MNTQTHQVKLPVAKCLRTCHNWIICLLSTILKRIVPFEKKKSVKLKFSLWNNKAARTLQNLKCVDIRMKCMYTQI